MKSVIEAAIVLIAAFHLANVTPANAQAQPPVPAPASQAYIHFAGGYFSPDSNAQLPNESGQFGLALGGGWRQSRHIAWEIEFFIDSQRVDIPNPPSIPFGSVDSRADISTGGVAGNVRFIYPLCQFEPYVGAGIGFYRSELEITGSIFGLPGSIEKSDNNAGIQLLAGMEYRFGEKGSSLGVQYRKLALSASFGPEVPGDVDVGGEFWFLTYRLNF
jgi:opacity protein-like surface antigen